MTSAPVTFTRRARQAIADRNLQQALTRARQAAAAKSARATAHPDYQVWRQQGQHIRDRCLANLDVLLEQFEQNATAAGCRVHFAADSASASRIVREIAQSCNAQDAIKSKSMLSEEINLNRCLEDAGIEVIETDLGEYIIQISGSRPSHIIAPVFHMRREEIAELFALKHNQPRRDKPAEMVEQARRVLRPRMTNASVGITGANFLIAATGSTVLVSNEGNGRFCASLPRVRITVAGIEKLLGSADDLATMLRLLPRAATGQHSTAYVTISTGVGDAGPKQHHVVLIDNGRSLLLAGKYREILRCIRCGACMNHCPVYTAVGGHAYDAVYPGPLGAVLSPLLFGSRHNDLPQASTLCGACQQVCPVRIRLPELIRHQREDQADAGKIALFERMLYRLWMFAALRPRLYRLATKTATTLLAVLAGRRQIICAIAGWQPGWLGWRDLRIGPRKPTPAQKR